MTLRSSYLFVYGTLKRGYRNHRLIEGQQFIQESITQAVYRLYDNGSYPCLVRSEPGLAIQGEIYLVEASLFRLLDRLEGVPDLYRREEMDLQDFAEPTLGYLYQKEVRTFRDCGICWP